MVRAGLILFAVVTALASLIGNIGYEATHYTPPGQFVLINIPSHVTWTFHTLALTVVTLPSILLLMLAVWRGVGHPLVMGLVALVLVASTLSLLNYLDMALSPYEGKRSAQWSAVPLYLAGLACVLPAYLVSYFLLRRTKVMAPLLARAVKFG